MEVSEKLKSIKYLLFRYHDNWPMYKYFLLSFAQFGLQTASFLNTHKTTDIKLAH